MKSLVMELVDQYDPSLPLEEASTIPSSWYIDDRIYERERRTTFSRTWQLAGRVDQLREPGQYVTCEIAGEPIVLVRGSDGELRGFFNVCRHHAAAVMTEPSGCAQNLRCPYHGWTYTLEGALKGTPSFNSECHFDRSEHGLAPVATAVWENWVFVRLDAQGPSLEEFLGQDLIEQIRPLQLGKLHWFERRHYFFDCNWKVFVDNYLDGGYHVPHLHKGLDSVLDYKNYTIENGTRFCLQSSPLTTNKAQDDYAAVRKGDRALYYWIHPNLMINWYEGMMDTNLVLPMGVDKTEVIFDFWFADVSETAHAYNRASIDVGQQIQDEDMAICKSVQRGLHSRAYSTGRLSARREGGEHLFHRLLHADLTTGG
ncbi:aromatic ring-hydroxylating oxygenase subunit alpha [Lysobacter niastensis]|uniref:Aromatic ring-hydroxylating dioxygenase subunit alpha n=1 Tax=Lysobacter niastensis TaxID=380629 RepID=A0ABS0B5H6_9GAMM|nr:aromatic ring-hydroxylating dioxygenase subunit alpha [Lysobacter niastensis]MBF6024091.1 aromatic ring-hydroxylating dioxygenase subunit alpha [Lysobacter niastensis]